MIVVFSIWRRATILPATALVLLLLVCYVMRLSNLTVWQSNNNRTWIFRPETPLLAIAGLCCFYAALASIAYIPFSESLGRWHPVLTVAALSVMGFGIWGLVVRMSSQSPSKSLGLAGTVGILLVTLGSILFSGVQLWFAIDFFTALIRLRRS